MASTRFFAAALLLLLPSTCGAYFAPVPGHTEVSWTFPITPGGFVWGMDIGPVENGSPVVAFSESGTLYQMRAGQTSVLSAAASPVFSSFVLTDTANARYFHAESSGGGIWQTGFDGSATVQAGTVPLAYDAALDSSGRLFISCAESYSGPSKVVCLDPVTQSLTTIASFPGPTGPVAADGGGNLYYGTSSAVFGQTGGQSIYRIDAAQLGSVLSGGPALSVTDLVAVAQDIDSPGDLLVLADGSLLFSTSVTSPGRIVRMQGSSQSVFAQLDSTSLFVTNLAYYEGSVFINIGGVYGPNWSPYGAIAQLVPEPGSLMTLTLLAGAAAGLARRRRS